MWGFAATCVIVFAVLMLALMGTGLDPWTAFSSLAATINDAGPGLGTFGTNFSGANAAAL